MTSHPALASRAPPRGVGPEGGASGRRSLAARVAAAAAAAEWRDGGRRERVALRGAVADAAARAAGGRRAARRHGPGDGGGELLGTGRGGRSDGALAARAGPWGEDWGHGGPQAGSRR